MQQDMLRLVPFLLGAVGGAFFLRERRLRLGAERLGGATLETLLEAIAANDPGTGAHVRRVADYSLLLAEAADLDAHTQRSIERVALFHDIGKLDSAITDIIDDARGLTPDERRAIMRHPRMGAEVLSPLTQFYPDLPEGVLSHHERWDGTGYPRHLKGKRIPISARVVAIADSFDAITHARAYSHARTLKTAVEKIAAGRGGQFDPELTDLFLSPPVLESVAKSMRESHTRHSGPQRRRPAGSKAAAPDITFRWRTATHGRLPSGR